MATLLPELKGTASYLRPGALPKSVARAAAAAATFPRPVFAEKWKEAGTREDLIIQHYEGRLVFPQERPPLPVKARHRKTVAARSRVAVREVCRARR
jgi:hypothetical protein